MVRPTMVTEVAAATFEHLGALARSLPLGTPVIPVIVSGGYQLGALIPGTGLKLDYDLRHFGITRGLVRNVMPRSLWMRGLDWARGNPVGFAAAAACLAATAGTPALGAFMMGALSNYDSVVEAIGEGRSHIVLWSPGLHNVTYVANGVFVFTYALHSPAPFTFSSGLAATAPNNLSSGAINGYAGTPDVGQQCVVTAVHELNQLPALIFAAYRTHILVDVLYECGTVPMNTTSLQTLGAAALTRYTSGLGVFGTAVMTTGSSNTNSTATITYTNSAGTGSRSGTLSHASSSFGAQYNLQPGPHTTAIPRFPYIIMQAGDLGMRSIESVQWSNSVASGAMNFMLYKPLAVVLGGRFANMVTDDLLTRMSPLVLDREACLSVFHGTGNDGSFRDIGSLFAFRFAHI